MSMEIEELFRKLKPVLGERVDALWLDYQLNPESKKELEGLLRALASQHLGSTFEEKEVLLVPPSVEVGEGDYELGRIVYGSREQGRFGLRENEWIQHIGIFGRTGSGKTNVGMLILRKLLEKQKPFFIFDWKRNYRDILSWPESKDIRVFTVGRDVSPFRFNPLIPPSGTQPTVWLKKLIEIMCHVYWLGEGVAYLLQNAIDAVYEASGAYHAEPDRWPTLADVRDWLLNHKAKGREAQWMDSTLRAIGTLCYGEVGNVFNSPSPTPLRELLGQNVILELDTLSNSDKTFLIEAMLLWVHHFRMQEPTRERFKHAILIEEAHHVLLKRKESKESVMDVIVREIRELGESLIIIDQHPSLISIPALGNTHCTIAMNLKHARDVNAIADAILLDESEKEYLGRTEVGTGIVKLQSRWTEPFLVRFPLVQVSKGSVTDEKLPPARPGDSGISEHVLPVHKQKAEILPIQAGEKIAEGKYRIGENETRMLLDVMKNPTSSISSRYKRLLFGVARGASLVDSLVSSNLLTSDFVSLPEGRVRFLQLTDKGIEALKECGYNFQRKRAGGPEHEYWKHKVAELLRAKGYEVTIEKPIGGGQTVDIEAQRDGKAIAIEIETGKSDAKENLRKLVEAGYDDIWMVFTGNIPKSEILIEPDNKCVRFLRVSEIVRR